MAADPEKPGFLGLLRGEGDDVGLNAVAWLAVMVAVFASASVLWWALGILT